MRGAASAKPAIVANGLNAHGLAGSVSEDELVLAIVEAALFLGYQVHHDRRSDLARQQGTAGFPDLVLVRAGVVWFVECKRERARLEPAQFAWFHALGWPDPPNVHLRVWFPSDLDTALRELA